MLHRLFETDSCSKLENQTHLHLSNHLSNHTSSRYPTGHVCVRACVRACERASVRACVRACVCVLAREQASAHLFLTWFFVCFVLFLLCGAHKAKTKQNKQKTKLKTVWRNNT